MSKVIAFSLFGYNKEKHPDCFDHLSLLRGLSVNIRLAKLIYPDWVVYCAVDKPSYEAHKDYFEGLKRNDIAEIEILDPAPLCQSMLWRLRPIFKVDPAGYAKHSHVICRDLDSPLTYRERQCVEQWVSHDKCVHAMTDSISHNLPLMGGMVGFVPKHFTLLTNIYNFEELVSRGEMDLSSKGTDQLLMMKVIYPCVAKPGQDSITQHYLLGIGNTFLSDWHNTIPDIDLNPFGVPDVMKESNNCCNHLGMSGYYERPTWEFLNKYKDRFTVLNSIEKPYSNIFHWQNT